TARAASTGRAARRRQYDPVTILKRIDKATPLIAKALTQNQVIDGKFLFFRPNPTGDGTTQQFYTVEISKGRVAHQKQSVEVNREAQLTDEAPLEEVSFTFHTIKWTYMDGGIEHQDTWSENV